jgi:hypothetical protein
MFQPPIDPREEEPEEVRPPSQRFYYPQPVQKESEFLEGVSKQTLIFMFAALFVGILLGKSMTPVVLRQ